MKTIFLKLIKAYWFIIPESKRNCCIFRESCSRYVYRKIIEDGFFYGLKAFRFRYQNCRPGYQLIILEKEVIMITVKNEIFLEKDIDQRIINP